MSARTRYYGKGRQHKAVTMEMVVDIKSALLNTTNTRQIFTMAFEFNFESMVRGYHVYKDVWDATMSARSSAVYF